MPWIARTATGVTTVATLVLSALATASPAAAGQRACAGWTVKPSPSTGSATLSAVAATSAYAFYELHVTHGWPWPLALLVAVGLLGAVLGVGLP